MKKHVYHRILRQKVFCFSFLFTLIVLMGSSVAILAQDAATANASRQSTVGNPGRHVFIRLRFGKLPLPDSAASFGHTRKGRIQALGAKQLAHGPRVDPRCRPWPSTSSIPANAASNHGAHRHAHTGGAAAATLLCRRSRENCPSRRSLYAGHGSGLSPGALLHDDQRQAGVSSRSNARGSSYLGVVQCDRGVLEAVATYLLDWCDRRGARCSGDEAALLLRELVEGFSFPTQLNTLMRGTPGGREGAGLSVWPSKKRFSSTKRSCSGLCRSTRMTLCSSASNPTRVFARPTASTSPDWRARWASFPQP